jgi:hypothetical protein
VFGYEAEKKNTLIAKYESVVLQKTANLLLDGPEVDKLVGENEKMTDGEMTKKFLDLTSTTDKASIYLFASLTTFIDLLDTVLSDASAEDTAKVMIILKSNKEFVEANALFVKLLGAKAGI